MMGQLAVIPTPAAIEAAWEDYSRQMQALIDAPELAVNRSFMEDVARAERRWKDAFLASDR
jgi:hypothetical protein